jgi:hypothetical protein
MDILTICTNNNPRLCFQWANEQHTIHTIEPLALSIADEFACRFQRRQSCLVLLFLKDDVETLFRFQGEETQRRVNRENAAKK